MLNYNYVKFKIYGYGCDVFSSQKLKCMPPEDAQMHNFLLRINHMT